MAELGSLDRLRAWLVTGAPGRGFAFAVDFAAAARTLWKARRGQARKAADCGVSLGSADDADDS